MRHLIMPLLAVAATVLITNTAYADHVDELFKLLPKDGAAGDQFGSSLAISGPLGKEVAIVGAGGDDENGGNSGSAYLFDTTTGQQIAKFLPDDGATDDWFGWSVAINGETAIVGAWRNDDNSGSAYLFDATTGRQIAKLIPDDSAAEDQFGISVAISGATAIVGSNFDDDNGDESGSAYLFDATTGRQIAKLLPNDGDAYNVFGNSVAIYGTTAIVGAMWDDDNGPGSGSAYLFDTTKGRQIAKLLPNDGSSFDFFGVSVAICGSTAIVGAWGDGANPGSAYLFDTTTGQQLVKLLPSYDQAGAAFGISVAISGSSAIVGAGLDDTYGPNSGAAFLFDTTTGKQIAKIRPSDYGWDALFGWSVAINGSTVMIGSPGDNDNGSYAGSAYIFDASPCPWDLDGNAVVGASDVLSLLGSWGPCKCCPADFDGNGVVGASDILALLANWGPCP